jgi:hypothetical protein
VGRIGKQESLSDLQFPDILDFIEFLEFQNGDAVLSGDGAEGLSFFHKMLGNMDGGLAGFRRCLGDRLLGRNRSRCRHWSGDGSSQGKGWSRSRGCGAGIRGGCAGY